MHSETRHLMKVTGKIYDPVASLRRKNSRCSWMCLRGRPRVDKGMFEIKQISTFLRIRNPIPRSSSSQSCHYTERDEATTVNKE